LIDFVGAILELYAFDAYGNAIGFDPSVALTEFLYSGEQFDSKIGQQYLRARYYDPATGRFNRLDPFFGNLNDPQSFHKYLYVHADPVNGIDPTGRNSVTAVLTKFLDKISKYERKLSWLDNAEFSVTTRSNSNPIGMLGSIINEATVTTNSLVQYKTLLMISVTASRLVYTNKTGNDFEIIQEWSDAKSGLKATLYKHKLTEKKVLAFSGTNGADAKDWRTNIGQAIGIHEYDTINQYNQIKTVVEQAKEHGTIDIITGHSLGGGLATLAKLLYGNGPKLVIFNPAYLHKKTITNILGNPVPPNFFNEDDTHVWHVIADPLTSIQSGAAGTLLYDFPKHYYIKFTLPKGGGLRNVTEDILNELDSVRRHALDVFEVFFETLPNQ
jgi:RHS repeat-associated protein